jgi:hypothetical protein
LAFSPGSSGLQPRRALCALIVGACSPFALAALVPALEACNGNDTTGGRRVILHTRLELKSTDVTSFDNGLDWHVTLEQAWIATGAFAYFDGVPPLTALLPPPVRASSHPALDTFLGVGVAYAHPGHYHAGNALGEMLEPWSVDLMSGTSTLADGDGVSGSYRSARFTFGSPPRGPYASELAGHAAVVAGRAELEGEATRYFRAVADVAELAEIQPEGNIDGCPFDTANIQDDGTVTVRVDPSVWFDLVDFGELEPGSSSAPTEFVAGTQPRLAFAEGLAQLSAYQFSYSK